MAAEVFLVLWRRAIRLTPDEERPWLFGTARKVTANLLRSRQRYELLLRKSSTVLAAGVNDRLNPMDVVDATLDVRAAVAKLPPKEQEALLLVEWDDVDMVTGARITGCTPNAFKVRLHRARRRLAQLLSEAQPSDVFGAERMSDERR
ncbi:RNA polymerase sigma factor [Kribbella swartbergensis]